MHQQLPHYQIHALNVPQLSVVASKRLQNLSELLLATKSLTEILVVREGPLDIQLNLLWLFSVL